MVKLTEKEIIIIVNHLSRDLSYGYEGTFGDGEKLYNNEIKIAEKAIKKLKKEFYNK